MGSGNNQKPKDLEGALARIEELEAENAALRNRNRYCEEAVEAMRPKAEAYGVSYEFDWSRKRCQ